MKNDYLFIKDNVPNDYLQEYDESIRKLSIYGVMDILRRLNQKAKISTGKGSFNKIRSHVFRRFFYNTVSMNNVNEYKVDFMCGKTIKSNINPYVDFSEEDLRESYLQALPELTIEQSYDTVVIEGKKLEEMRKEYDKKYTELQKDTEIKLKETEMTTLIHPYKKDIEQLELHLEEERELLKSGKKSKLSPALNGYDEVDMTPSDVENTNNRIEFLKREIARNEYEINRIKEGYLEEIEEIKEKYNSMSEYN
jgi:hypothetical protein